MNEHIVMNAYLSLVFSFSQAPRSEVVLVISRCKSDATVESVGPPQSVDQVTSAKNGNNRHRLN